MSRTSVMFPCGDITLEGEWLLPAGDGPFPAVVVCHPHPLHGGDMHNNVVTAICQALAHQSIAALKFNFRGVGRSGGTFGEGIAEQEDVRAALTFVAASPDIDSGRIGVAGYSFGARVALAVALDDDRVARLALVSPPIADDAWAQLAAYLKPKFLAVGDADEYVPLEHFRQKTRALTEPRDCRVVSGTDHFWWGFERGLGHATATFFAAGFARPASNSGKG